MTNITKLFITAFILFSLFLSQAAFAQDIENEYQTRTFVSLSIKPWEKLKISLSPELRFDEGFELDKYVVEGELNYSPIKLISIEGSYRFIGKQRKKKGTEYLHRYAFGIAAKKSIKRFEPSVGLRYTNYVDNGDENSSFLEYKGELGYNIKKLKLTPFMAFQLYQELVDNTLYKTRYSAGVDYSLSKRSSIQASYKFDYYMYEYKNKHIFKLGYKIKL